MGGVASSLGHGQERGRKRGTELVYGYDLCPMTHDP